MSKYFTLLFLLMLSLQVKSQQSELDEKLKTLLSGSVQAISCQEATEIINSGKNILLFDTRSTAEYNISHINNAQLIEFENFDVDQVRALEKNDTLIFYCTVGY